MKNKNKWLMAMGSLVAIGASLFLIMKKKNKHEEKPPKEAPQLHIENPGTQADFPSSATESEVG